MPKEKSPVKKKRTSSKVKSEKNNSIESKKTEDKKPEQKKTTIPEETLETKINRNSKEIDNEILESFVAPEFSIETDNFSPSLERKNLLQGRTPIMLEEEIEETPISRATKTQNPTEYMSSIQNESSPKYMQYEQANGNNIKQFSEFEKDLSKSFANPAKEMQEAEFRFYESSSRNNSDGNGFEKYSPVKNFNLEERKNKNGLDKFNPAERKEMKYRKM